MRDAPDRTPLGASASGPVSLSLSRVQSYLGTRSPREQAVLRIGAIVLGLAALISALDWSQRTRDLLHQRLPLAERTLLQMQSDAEALLNLGTVQVRPALPTSTLADTVLAAGTARRLSLEVEISDNTLLVSGHGALPRMLELSAAMQADHGLRTTDVRWMRADDGDRFELRLAPLTNNP